VLDGWSSLEALEKRTALSLHAMQSKQLMEAAKVRLMFT
jgi:hypothetical protein